MLKSLQQLLQQLKAGISDEVTRKQKIIQGSSANYGTTKENTGYDDVESFKNNNRWLIHHPVKAKIFADLRSVWNQLLPTYNGSFKTLVIGSFPGESSIFATLVRIKERLSAIEWTIEIDE